MPFIIKSRGSGRSGARPRATAAVVVSVTFIIGSFAILAATAAAAPASAAAAAGSLAASSAWKIQSTPNPAGSNGSYLLGVSCTAASACTAVGTYNTGRSTLAERWNGTTWAIQATPNPAAGSSYHSLNGVSCTSASACTAVGSYLNSSGTTVTLAEQWNGTTWKTQTTPNPAGAGHSQLNGVSCTSASACTAVGYYYNSSSVFFTLAERWNGTTWTIQATPNPGGSSQPQLQGVSCASASACTAAGGYNNSSGAPSTLAERWNGKSWAIQGTTNPGPETNYLNGVSCTSASACTAAGYQQLSSGQKVPLAERWNGTTWATQTTPNPGGTNTNVFLGVSCTAASACTAAGSYSKSNTEPTAPFAEGWNGGSWTVQTTPSPAGTDYSPLVGVSCTAANVCTAVGTYQDSSGTYRTLAESE